MSNFAHCSHRNSGTALCLRTLGCCVGFVFVSQESSYLVEYRWAFEGYGWIERCLMVMFV
jgi:hypothetical protein